MKQKNQSNLIIYPKIQKNIQLNIYITLSLNLNLILNSLLNVNNLLHTLGEKQLPQEECEYLWTRYHIQRFYNKHSIYRNEETNPLQIVQNIQQKKQVKFENEKKEKQLQQNQFNVLKDTVRIGNLDKEKREREKAELEQKLFENIDKIKDISDMDSFRPLKYIVKFDEMGNIVLDNQELKDEDVEKLQGKQQNVSFDEFADDDVKISKVDTKKFQNDQSDENSSDHSESDDSEDDYLAKQRSLIKGS